MHVRFIDSEDADGEPVIDLEVPRVPDHRESVILQGFEWDVIDVVTVYDTPTGEPERYDVRILKRVQVDPPVPT